MEGTEMNSVVSIFHQCIRKLLSIILTFILILFSFVLPRVSFGSSKGSMVETLVFETPTPLPEHAEREFGFPANKSTGGQCANSSSGHDDSGIGLQEE